MMQDTSVSDTELLMGKVLIHMNVRYITLVIMRHAMFVNSSMLLIIHAHSLKDSFLHLYLQHIISFHFGVKVHFWDIISCLLKSMSH